MPGHYGKKMKKPMGKKKKMDKKKKQGKKKYSKKQMKIARVAEPRDRITGADFAKLRKSRKKRYG